MNTQPLKNYFFAGAAAGLALLFFAWHLGYEAGSTQSRFAPRQLPVTNGFRGTITDIRGTTIVLKSSMPQDTGTHQIFTNATTTIDQIVPKDAQVFESELRAAKASAEKQSSTTTPPLPYTIQKVSLADLHAGNSIIVLGDTVAGYFTASRIIVEPPLISPTSP